MEHNDELYLKQTVGNRNPFQVPEGYFEQLTEQVMQQLPERQPSVVQLAEQPEQVTKPARTQRLRPWFYAAASVALALVMGVSYYFTQSPSTTMDGGHMAAASAPAAVAPLDNSYIDEAADYCMLDNTEIYAYLSEN